MKVIKAQLQKAKEIVVLVDHPAQHEVIASLTCRVTSTPTRMGCAEKRSSSPSLHYSTGGGAHPRRICCAGGPSHRNRSRPGDGLNGQNRSHKRPACELNPSEDLAAQASRLWLRESAQNRVLNRVTRSEILLCGDEMLFSTAPF
jgi:hypothetical protein